MNPVLSSLALIDSTQICLHEKHESTRLKRTSAAIAREGVLRHPPLAMQMSDGRYLILDGAHRTCALQTLGCNRIPLQVVNRAEIVFESWDHLVPAGIWLNELQQEPQMQWEKVKTNNQLVAQVEVGSNRYFVYKNAAHVNQSCQSQTLIDAWHRMVQAYSHAYAVKRIASGSNMNEEEGMVRLSFPTYSLDELEQIVLSGNVMPAGVTRVVINGRLLNLNIPLTFLMEHQVKQDEWEQHLHQWSRSLRLYSESVYLCEV